MILLESGDILSTVVWFLMFFVLVFLYPRLMLSQMIFKLEQSATKLEHMAERSVNMTARKVEKNPSKELKKKIEDFSEFFVIEPSNIDPYGLVKKIDQTIRGMEDRFDEFVDDVAKKRPYNEKQQSNHNSEHYLEFEHKSNYNTP